MQRTFVAEFWNKAGTVNLKKCWDIPLTPAVLVMLCSLQAATSAHANDRSGSWGPLLDWNINPIHAILTPGNTLMTFGQGGGVEYSVWQIGMGTLPFSRTIIGNNTGTDLFCASQIVLPDSAKVLMTGGDQLGGGNPGNPNTTIFDDQDNSLTDAGITMEYARWYPTTIALPNGEILAQGGRAHDDPNVPVITPEIYNPGAGWRTLNGATSEYAYGGFKWWYPRSWIIPNGLAFGISGNSMFYVDYQNDGDIVSAGNFSKQHTFETSTAVMYRPGKILQLGGGGEGNIEGTPATNTASFVDVTGSWPVVTDAPELEYARHWADTTILPDGNVLVTGGSQLNNSLGGDGPVLTPELFDVETNQWSLMAAEEIPRLYHSFAILLPDATVLTAGGGEPGPITNRNAQIFSPPYLFEGDQPAPRPIIELASSELRYGASVVIRNLSDTNVIDRVTLVKTGAVTHSFNSEQRFVELELTARSGQQITAQLPDSPTIATPGYYLMFAIDTNGTPSVGEFVHFAPDPGYVPPASPIEFCENVTSPGAITTYQNIPAYETPATIYSVKDAWGGLDGEIMYQWFRSTEPVDSGSEAGWEEIPGAINKWYTPPPLQETTYFARRVKRSECEASFTTSAAMVEVTNTGTTPAPTPIPEEPVDEPINQPEETASIDSCNYDLAYLNNGWGWDAVNFKSCAPDGNKSAVDTCIYDQSDLNNGWGWDPVNGKSCEPRVTE